MKILIVNSFYYPHERGGAEKSVRILAENIAKRRHDVTVLTLSDVGEFSREIISNVTVVRLPIKNIYHPNEMHNISTGINGKLKKIVWHFIDTFNFFSKHSLKNHLDNLDFDVVHTNNVSGFSVSVWDWAKEKNIPVVHTSRDYYLFNPNCTMYSANRNDDPNSLKIKLLSCVKKIKSKNVSSYVGISSFISELHLKNGFFRNSKNNRVIYNGVGGSASDEYKLIRKERLVAIVNKPMELGYLGRIDRAKGIELVIDYLKSSSLNFTLKIGGGGNPKYIEYLKSKCEGDERFVFLGHVEIQNYFSTIDCLICSSLWNEPMGRVVIESFSYGVPVIGSRVGGISELINVNKTGFTFDMNSKDSFLKAINEYQNSDKSQISNLCYSEAEKYSDDIYVDNYLDVYKSVIT